MSVLAGIEAKVSIHYAAYGTFDSPLYPRFASLLPIESLGAATADSATNCRKYLVASTDTSFVVRTVSLSSGKVRHLVDQLENQDTITFAPGGLWKSNFLFYGQIGTASR